MVVWWTVLLSFFLPVAIKVLAENPFSTLLDKNCATIFMSDLPMSKEQFKQNAMAQLLERGTGIMLLSPRLFTHSEADRIRSTWSCFDIVMQRHLPQTENSWLRARNSRHIFIPSSNASSLNFLTESREHQTQDVFFILLKAQNNNYELKLRCPSLKRNGPDHFSDINHFSSKTDQWTKNENIFSRPQYSLCNPSHNFYYKRDMDYTAVLRNGVEGEPTTIAVLVANYLGAASIKVHGITAFNFVDQYGNVNENSALGQIHYRRNDFGSTIRWVPAVAKYGDFLAFNKFHAFFITQKPDYKPQIGNIIYPFTWKTWIVLIFSVIATTCMFLAIFNYRKRPARASLIDIGFLALGILFGENHFKVFKRGAGSNKGISGEELRLVWLLCASLLAIMYHGNLKASLARKSFAKPVETHEEMLNMDLPIYTPMYALTGGKPLQLFLANPDTFVGSTTISFDRLYQHLKKHKSLVSIPEMYQKMASMLEGERAFLYATNLHLISFQSFFTSKYGRKEFPLRPLREKLEDSTGSSEHYTKALPHIFSYQHTYMTYIFKRYMPQTEVIAKVVRGLEEAGIVKHHFDRHDPFHGAKQTTTVNAATVEANQKLGLNHILAVSIALAIGFLAAVIILPVEHCVNKKKSN